MTLVGIVAAIFAITQVGKGNNNVVENWWGASPIARSWKTMPVTKTASGATVSAGNNFINTVDNPSGRYVQSSEQKFVGPLADNRFIKTPQFQGLLSPRFGNYDAGANIRYNPADYKNQAVPCNPMTFGNMVKENYGKETYGKENFTGGCGTVGCGGACGGGCSPSCGKGGQPVDYMGGRKPTPPGYAAGNFNQETDKLYSQGAEATDMLPVGTMTTVDAEGNVEQPVVYQQFVFANKRSRLRGLADYVRGDLPIKPLTGPWFVPAVNANLDLNAGAMNVLGGVTNATNQSLALLINDASGGGDTTLGGVNLAEASNNVSMTPQYSGQYTAALKDVSVAGMP